MRLRLKINQNLGAKLFFAFLFCVYVLIRYNHFLTEHGGERSFLTRRLSETEPDLKEKCKPAKGAVDEFPPDFMTQEQRYKGGIIFHVTVTFYMFGLLAVVCDDYFVLSLYHICLRLQMDKDVAGATFMAIGSSAPTLFISIVSIFFTDSAGDVGLGTVVGSTIFNTLFIVSICAMVTTIPARVSQWPLLRDSFVYILGTISLAITIRDRRVYWYEACLFVLVYMLYIVIIYFNKELGTVFNNTTKQVCGELEDEDSEMMTMTSKTTMDDLLKPPGNDGAPKNHDVSSNNSMMDDLGQFEHKQESPLQIPDGCISKIVWILGFPVMILFYITIPPCCKKRWSEWFLVTFAMSVMWMGFLSYILVWMVVIIGDTFDIPDCIMGMTFLAAGSSIPDVMASVIVARQGMADMALSNAIGSNVFDMLCLGLPWLLKTTVMDPGSFIVIQSQSIMISTLLLIGSIVFTIVAIHLNNWRLELRLGIIFLIIYIVFISLATLIEFLACPCQIEDFLPV